MGRLPAGLDIGCGANCIYPLLAAALNQWRFVGADITDVAITWATRNVEANPQLSELIEIRRTGCSSNTSDAANINQVTWHPAFMLIIPTTVTTTSISQGLGAGGASLSSPGRLTLRDMMCCDMSDTPLLERLR